MNKGYFVILSGYIGWGLFPLYWALLKHVPSLEVLLHRMLWSLPVLIVLVWLSERRRNQVNAALRSWRELKWLALSSIVISFNWGLYIWAVANERVVEASMGYFLTPLLNVLAGVIVFKEQLNRASQIAVLCAAAGVAYYIFSTAIFPWVGLALGGSFAIYGLLRKQMSTNAVPGLFIEVLLLMPFTLLVISPQARRTTSASPTVLRKDSGGGDVRVRLSTGTPGARPDTCPNWFTDLTSGVEPSTRLSNASIMRCSRTLSFSENVGCSRSRMLAYRMTPVPAQRWSWSAGD